MKTRSFLIGFLAVLVFAAACSDGGEGLGPDPELAAVCGNGTIEAGESCDDGNTVADDGCDELCRTECSEGMVCATSVPPVCGNGQLENGEECDDGNTRNSDGCSMLCRTDLPAVCGNLRVETGEDCDGIVGTTPGHRCSSSCRLEVVTNPCSGIAAITVSGPSSLNCSANANCSASFTASGGNGNFRWTARNLPEGMSLPSVRSGATIQVSGGPSTGGRIFTITAGAAECSSASGSKDVTVNVAETISLRLYRWNRYLTTADKWEEVRKTTSGMNGKPRPLQSGSSTGTGTGTSGIKMINTVHQTHKLLEQPTWGKFYKLEVAGSSARSFTWQHTPSNNSEICFKGTQPDVALMNSAAASSPRTCNTGGNPTGTAAYLYLKQDRPNSSRLRVEVSATNPQSSSLARRSVSFSYSSPPSPPPPSATVVRKVVKNARLTIWTGRLDGAGTDANVSVRFCDTSAFSGGDACSYSERLDNPDRDDFEGGNVDSFEINNGNAIMSVSPDQNLNLFFRLELHRNNDSMYFPWLLQGMKLEYEIVEELGDGNQRPLEHKVYWNPSIQKWFVNETTATFGPDDVAFAAVVETRQSGPGTDENVRLIFRGIQNGFMNNEINYGAAVSTFGAGFNESMSPRISNGAMSLNWHEDITYMWLWPNAYRCGSNWGIFCEDYDDHEPGRKTSYGDYSFNGSPFTTARLSDITVKLNNSFSSPWGMEAVTVLIFKPAKSFEYFTDSTGCGWKIKERGSGFFSTGRYISIGNVTVLSPEIPFHEINNMDTLNGEISQIREGVGFETFGGLY